MPLPRLLLSPPSPARCVNMLSLHCAHSGENPFFKKCSTFFAAASAFAFASDAAFSAAACAICKKKMLTFDRGHPGKITIFKTCSSTFFAAASAFTFASAAALAIFAASSFCFASRAAASFFAQSSVRVRVTFIM